VSPYPSYLPNFPMLADTVSSMRWWARAAGFQFTGMLQPLAPSGGMPDTLASKEINTKGRFLTTGVPLPPVVSPAFPSWLILSAPWGVLRRDNLQIRLNTWVLLYMNSTITLLFSCSMIVPWEPGYNGHHLQSPMQVECINIIGCCPMPQKHH
jgi:hypothetical protein